MYYMYIDGLFIGDIGYFFCIVLDIIWYDVVISEHDLMTYFHFYLTSFFYLKSSNFPQYFCGTITHMNT